MVATRRMNGTPSQLLQAQTAADLMTPNPVSIRNNATITEAVELLTDKGFSGAPVIDEAGHPIGVLSRADIVAYDRERARHAEPGPGTARVRDLMTPAVFSVAPKTPVKKVIAEMVALEVHRLFVVDHSGVLVGVISALDVLRRLQLD
jgi:CBS domain-containing protein